MTVLPTLFVSHGAPTFAVEPGVIGPQLRALAAQLPVPRAVVIVSPHWQTSVVQVTTGVQPATIHDFGGFPPALYELQYPAPGAPDVAAEVLAELAQHGIDARGNASHGLDHGAWVPLRYLYPEADVPVVQLSLPRYPQPQDYLAFGRALAALRERGVLVIGSGSLTHNLYEFSGPRTDIDPYVTAFTGWMRAAIARGDLAALLDYRRQAPEAARAHPEDEHLMPLFVALGAAGADWNRSQLLDGGVVYGMLAMDAFLFGMP